MRLITRLEQNNPADAKLQDCVYWAATGQKDNYGNPVYATPVDMKVMWQDVTEAYSGRGGETRMSRAKAFLGRDVTLLGVLYRGKLSQLSAPQKADPFSVPGALEIQKFDKIPLLNGRQYWRVAYL